MEAHLVHTYKQCVGGEGGWLRIPEAKKEAYKYLNMLVERSGLEVGTIGGYDKLCTHQAGK